MSDGRQDWRPTAPRAPRSDQFGQPTLPDAPSPGPGSQATPVRPMQGEQVPPAAAPEFDAVGMQSVLTRARDQSRFVAPEPEPEARSRSLPLKGLLAGLIGVLLIGVVAGAAYVTWLRPQAEDPDVVVKVTSTASEQVQAQTPQEIVTEYFKALSEGDVERALSMGPTGGNGTTTLISAQVYATTMEQTPITDVQILTEDPTALNVDVTYTLGGDRVEATVALVRLDTGAYQLARTTTSVQLDVPGGENVPLLVNGKQVDQGQTFELVPGRYVLTSGVPFIDYPASDSFTVPRLSATAMGFTGSPQLTDAGRQALTAAAKASLDHCLQQKSLAPSHCPFATTTRKPVDQSQIAWSLLNNPLASSIATLSSSDQSVAEMSLTLQLKVALRYADGTTSAGQPYEEAVRVRATMLGTDPAEVAVTWIR